MQKPGNLELWNESSKNLPQCYCANIIIVEDLLWYDWWCLIVNMTNNITIDDMVFSPKYNISEKRWPKWSVHSLSRMLFVC